MKWITREKIKVDRVACPWLIKKIYRCRRGISVLPRNTDWARINNGIVYMTPGGAPPGRMATQTGSGSAKWAVDKDDSALLARRSHYLSGTPLPVALRGGVRV